MNDHGLPLALYPRREICVTLEVATGVGGGIGTKEDGREESDHEPVERVIVWARRISGGQVEMETVLSVCCKSRLGGSDLWWR